jgi:8-hydroxy-5-deazaflavin:NADPH oxidoreductase
MKIGILGTGSVGEALGSALAAKGHKVCMGSRQAGNEKAVAWTRRSGEFAREGSFADAAAYGDVLFLCLNGAHALQVAAALPAEAIAGKILIDLTNPLDFSKGMPPRILEDYLQVSLAEQIQKALPETFVVKTLNTINYKLMVDAQAVGSGAHNLFISGNDITAKNRVKHLLVDNFNWRAENLIDLGGIEGARATEAIVPFWVLVWQSLGTPLFNFRIVQ